MKFDVIRDLNAIGNLQNSWNALAADRPFLSWDWHESWYRYYCDTPRQPFVVVEGTPGQAPSSIMPLYQRPGRLGTTKLCLSGDGNVCTDRHQIITQPGEERYSTFKLVRWLAAATQQGLAADYVDLDGLSLSSAPTQNLISQFANVGFKPELLPCESCWVVELESSWEQQNATFSKKHRRKTKKAAANLSELEIRDSSNQDFEYLWSHFTHLHQLRRTSLGEPGCFADQRFHDFLRLATQRLINRGLADILLIEHQQNPIAATVVFSDRTTAHMYQTGFDPAFVRLEPGYMLIVAAMQRAIETGHQKYDFMRGDEQYKSRWNAQAEPMTRTHVRLNNAMRVQLHHQLRRSKTIVKSTLANIQFPFANS